MRSHDDESVGHGRSSHLALGPATVLSRRKLGGCALLILRQPTGDAGCSSATTSDNHREAPRPSPLPTIPPRCTRGLQAE